MIRIHRIKVLNDFEVSDGYIVSHMTSNMIRSES
jgi:hypothetical protein